MQLLLIRALLTVNSKDKKWKHQASARLAWSGETNVPKISKALKNYLVLTCNGHSIIIYPHLINKVETYVVLCVHAKLQHACGNELQPLGMHRGTWCEGESNKISHKIKL